jgi:5'-3' exonuclease
MGVKGLYSCLKHFSLPVSAENEPPCRLAIDAYPFLYRFRENVNECIELFESLRNIGHQLTIFLDGTPPKEKMEELANRRKQKEVAYQQAKALRLFLQDEEKVAQLDEDARKVLEKQIVAYELESWSIRKEIREKFIEICKEKEFPLQMCIGESDTDLIQGSLQGKYDIVIANDMDLFVGGVERLWVLGKTNQDPLFQEFSRSLISHKLGVYPSCWADIALLTGYEKCPSLKRCSAQQAITYMRYYKNLETLFMKRPEMLGENTIEEYQKARLYFN